MLEEAGVVPEDADLVWERLEGRLLARAPLAEAALQRVREREQRLAVGIGVRLRLPDVRGRAHGHAQLAHAFRMHSLARRLELGDADERLLLEVLTSLDGEAAHLVGVVVCLRTAHLLAQVNDVRRLEQARRGRCLAQHRVDGLGVGEPCRELLFERYVGVCFGLRSAAAAAAETNHCRRVDLVFSCKKASVHWLHKIFRSKRRRTGPRATQSHKRAAWDPRSHMLYFFNLDAWNALPRRGLLRSGTRQE